MTDTSAEEISATCSAEFGTRTAIPASFMQRGIDEPDRPPPALPASGRRWSWPARWPGGKKMKVTRGLGERENRPSAAAAAATATTRRKQNAAAAVFSIHGHRRASRKSLEIREIRTHPASVWLGGKITPCVPRTPAFRPPAAAARHAAAGSRRSRPIRAPGVGPDGGAGRARSPCHRARHCAR